MRGPVWNTQNSDPARIRTGNRFSLTVLAVLFALVILAVVTGTVLASKPPRLLNSSPTAVHESAPDPVTQPEAPDPRDLFLDLPDPPVVAKPEPPETPEQNLNNQTSDNTASASKVSEGASAFSRPSGARNTRSPNRRAGGPDAETRAGTVPGVSNAPANRKPPPKRQAVEPGSGNVEDLLDDPDCRFSVFALTDLKAGIVDEYLISALQAVCREHSIYVNVFKTGHTFGSGLEEGPTIPAGYGNAGGYPNTHYFGRGADIWEVDGKPVESNGDDPDVVSVGRMLAGLPEKNSPDVVIGPDAWNRALGYGPEQGWVLAGDQVALHEDHLHIGYWEGDGTLPSNLSIPETKIPPHKTYPYTDSGVVRNSERSSDRTSSQASSRSSAQKPRPKPKEKLEPFAAPFSESRSTEKTIGKRDRRSGPQKTVMRWIQRNGPQDPQNPRDRQNPDSLRPDQEKPDRPKSEKTKPKSSEPEKTDPGKQPGADSPRSKPDGSNPGELQDREPQDREPQDREPQDREPAPQPDPKLQPLAEEEPQPGDISSSQDQYADPH